MTIITPSLREEIDLKMRKLAESPAFYDQRKKLVNEDLRSIGDVYSFWIENPELRKALLLENKQISTIKKKARHGIEAVHNGWYFLTHKGQHGDFVPELDATILQRVNGLIEPNSGETRQFRTRDVTLNIPNYTPPSWERVPQRVAELIAQVKEMNPNDPLEAAIYTHLGIAAIQPFMEGNKRTARLVQDRILFDAQMTPAIIPAGEGKFYFSLLNEAFPAYMNKDQTGQRRFFDYCASKVNNGLDEILNDLDANHQ